MLTAAAARLADLPKNFGKVIAQAQIGSGVDDSAVQRLGAQGQVPALRKLRQQRSNLLWTFHGLDREPIDTDLVVLDIGVATTDGTQAHLPQALRNLMR